MELWRRCLLVLASALCVDCQGTTHRRVSISGQSAGASFAVNHLFAFSASVDGAGIAAGNPYGCGDSWLRDVACYTGWLFDMQQSLAYTQDRARDGLIDDLKNLKNIPTVLFGGGRDTLVWLRVMRNAFKQFEHYVNPSYLHPVFNTSAAHVWSLDHGSCSCGECALNSGSALCCDVNNCGYDLSGDILRKTYGNDLKPRVAAQPRLHFFEQWPYVPSDTNSTSRKAWMERWAMAYVPRGCEQNLESCRVHVNYHGCTDTDYATRRTWVNNLDLNEYGEANDIIIVYPQAAGNAEAGNGCWNWYPYASHEDIDTLFDTKKGAQLRTVIAMLDDLPAALAKSIVVPNDAPAPPNATYDATLFPKRPDARSVVV